ncbi:hypothetical protein B0A49_09649 [Cryomyces minteri]|uniref:Uncharacterized protein n=1 Tax=Cryomyces minteri TaxID=331657 RepID=A0A4U0WG10_9PEZI|nr:hypothetical protein B0A49_09649 [Cryomyces minteri]
MAPEQRLRARPAHTPGPTFLSYTPNGKKLITVGLNNAIRVFETGSDAEPTNIDDCQESNTAVAAANDFFVTGSEDGTVCKYSLETNTLEGILIRCTLPVRDVALSSDGTWVAVASDELVVKVVNTKDMSLVIYLRDQTRPVKHVSFDQSGSHLAASCSDGQVYIYSLSSEQPKLVKKIDGLVKSLETDSEASSRLIWHPDGRAFAAPTPTRVMSTTDWERQRMFSSGHTDDITAAAWSHNGGLLATAGADRKLILWDTKSQQILKRYDDARATILALAWHPTENILSYTNNDGELFIHTDFVPSKDVPVLRKALQPAPFIHDPLAETSENARRPPRNGVKNGISNRHVRRGTPDSLDEIMGADGESELGDFIEDDDGAGYAEQVNGHGKRPNGHLDALDIPSGKRRAAYGTWQPQFHPPFQAGSTPWRGNRKYLCLNLTGFVWTVDQETHHTVTVEFYDREYHRDFHFTDPFLYDKACLNENAVGADGTTRLLYTIENVKRDDVCQSEDVVALTEGAELRSVFFSDNGDPCIYDSEGILLTLLHWRTPGQAKWVPLLDTKQLERLAGGRKEESYWPIAVAQDKFHCIILKAPAKETDDEEAAGSEMQKLEESFVRHSVMLGLMEDLVGATNATHTQRTELSRRELEIDKTLLQLLAVECREGEDRGMKALEVVGLMRDRSGRMLEAAGKVAARFGRDILGEKITQLAERRLVGLNDDDDM